jgi:gamma-glutamyl phosphate reductase
VLAQVAASAVQWAGIPEGAISIVSGGDRDELRQLATQDGVVDLIIPRGGEGLKAALKEHADILEAISDQDPEGARQAMRTHLMGSQRRYRRLAR